MGPEVQRPGGSAITGRPACHARDLSRHRKITYATLESKEGRTSEPRRGFPYRTIGEDDVAFADFGPIFEEYEADFGRTYVFGDDPDKHRLLADLPRVFDAGRASSRADREITGARLYAEVERLAAASGWEIGIWHAGHLVGEFPHETNEGAKAESYIAPDNHTPLRRTDRAGRPCHWILELHFVDRSKGLGGFYEQLLELA
ncbi:MULTISPECIES: M24 family metallopeptidase [unclassified Streptomyces]|uniref:M24 family metallopeptidase n=1 Tax=unclassified Streptomyces TaxID=2593676 RepID=UPI0035E37090